MLLSVLFDDDADESFITATYQVGSQVVQVKQKPHEGHITTKPSPEQALNELPGPTPNDPQRWPNVGLIIWQSAFALGHYLLLHPPLPTWSGVKVLELGSGTGILGIALAKAGAHVTLTDLPHITALTSANLDANLSGVVAPECCRVVDYTWGEDASAVQVPGSFPDVLVGSDVVYEPEHFDALLASMQMLCGPATLGFLCYRLRGSYREQDFEAKAKSQGFTLEVISLDLLPEDYRNGEYRALRFARGRSE